LEFYSTLKQILTPDAVVVVQTTSPYFAPKSFWCINKTMMEVFLRWMRITPMFLLLRMGIFNCYEWFQTNFNTVNRQVEGLRFL
jgi:spermidine synthase